ncbi:phosphodiester glycosidase family protein [bacterium]
MIILKRLKNKIVLILIISLVFIEHSNGILCANYLKYLFENKNNSIAMSSIFYNKIQTSERILQESLLTFENLYKQNLFDDKQINDMLNFLSRIAKQKNKKEQFERLRGQILLIINESSREIKPILLKENRIKTCNLLCLLFNIIKSEHSLDLIYRPGMLGNVRMINRETGKMEAILNGIKYVGFDSITTELMQVDELTDILFYSLKNGKKVDSFLNHDALYVNDYYTFYCDGNFFHPVPIEDTDLEKTKQKYMKKTYPSFVAVKNKEGSVRYSIEPIRYENIRNSNLVKPVKENGDEFEGEVLFAVGGPFVLTDENISFEQNIKKLLHEQAFQDIRHIFGFPSFFPAKTEQEKSDNYIYRILGKTDYDRFMEDITGGGFYFGSDQLLRDNNLARKALSEPVTLELTIFEKKLDDEKEKTIFVDALHASQKAFGLNYVRVAHPDNVTKRGQYAFLPNNKIKIFFHFNPYPNTILGITKEGEPVFCVWDGLSGRVGKNFREGVEFAKSLGCTKGLLLSTGSSTRVYHKGNYVIPSSVGRRYLFTFFAITSPLKSSERAAYSRELFEQLFKYKIQKEKPLNMRHIVEFYIFIENMKKAYSKEYNAEKIFQEIDNYKNDFIKYKLQMLSLSEREIFNAAETVPNIADIQMLIKNLSDKNRLLNAKISFTKLVNVFSDIIHIPVILTDDQDFNYYKKLDIKKAKSICRAV